MFEEAQLYAPVTRSGGGDVTVHLSDDHPGAVDPEYRARRNALAALAMEWQPGTPPPVAPYTEAEHEVWRIVCGELHGLHERLACAALSRGQAAAGAAGVPHPPARRGERTAAPAHGVPVRAGRGVWCPCWSSTAPSRTGSSTRPSTSGTTRSRSTRPSPTSCTRSSGTGTAWPTTGSPRLYRLAGDAARRVQTEAALEFVSKVFWFSLEFGVVREDGEVRCYGAGLLSSYGEIQQVAQADLRPLNIARMGVQTYDITHYQPILFCGDGFGQVEDVVGGVLRRGGRRPGAAVAARPVRPGLTGCYTPADLTQPRRGRSSADRTQDDLVAVEQECPGAVRAQVDRLRAVPGQLQQAAALVRRGPEMVPEPYRSPVRRWAPLIVRCAII